MADTTFVDGSTLTAADWFNDVNRLHYTIFGDPAANGPLSITLNSAEQVRIIGTASANRYITLTGSNGGNCAISASAGDVAFGVQGWVLGGANAVSPTSPNRTVTITIGATTLYLHAKTTND